MRHIQDIMWHMRGGVTREEAWTLSSMEREALLEDIKARVKTVEETGLALL